MATPAPRKAEPVEIRKPSEHSSGMVWARQRAAEEHRAQAARTAGFRHG